MTAEPDVTEHEGEMPKVGDRITRVDPDGMRLYVVTAVTQLPDGTWNVDAQVT